MDLDEELCIGEEVCILDWPTDNHGDLFRGVVIEMYGTGDVAKCFVELLTGMGVGDIHQFPARMLIQPERPQARLI